MLNITFAFDPRDPMSHIVENRIKGELLKGHNYAFVDIQEYPFAIETLQLQFNQTVIIKDAETNQELSRLERLFETEELENAIHDAVKFVKGIY